MLASNQFAATFLAQSAGAHRTVGFVRWHLCHYTYWSISGVPRVCCAARLLLTSVILLLTSVILLLLMVIAKLALALGCQSPFGLQHLIGVIMASLVSLRSIKILEVRAPMLSRRVKFADRVTAAVHSVAFQVSPYPGKHDID